MAPRKKNDMDNDDAIDLEHDLTDQKRFKREMKRIETLQSNPCKHCHHDQCDIEDEFYCEEIKKWKRRMNKR
jgi:hypothetical protein